MLRRFIGAAAAAVFALSSFGAAPEAVVRDGGVWLTGVGTDNPVIYDNDWWFDVFDNNYLWAQSSLKHCNLKGNIVSRDMWEWRKGYLYSMEQCVEDARKALRLARESGLKNIPDLTIGSSEAIVPPESGRIVDTVFTETDGSRLIVKEARKASPDKPLLVIAGGPLTTVATAVLSDPEIGPKMVVFSLTVADGGYNGKDSWSAYVVAKRTRLVDWATGSFWEKNSVFRPEHFDELPSNPFCDDMRRLIGSELGQANQLGDGAPLVWLWKHQCWKGYRYRQAIWRGDRVVFEPVSRAAAADLIDIPRDETDMDACREEFFRVLGDADLFGKR